MYHPPLYHFVAAICSATFGVFGEAAGRVGLKLPGFLAGLGTVWLSARLARRLYPDDRVTQIAALAFAATLPMNLYVSAFVSNEGLLAFLSAGALLAACDVLLSKRIDGRSVLALSVWTGLALLTKFTALVLAALTWAFAIGRFAFEGGTSGRKLAREAALLAVPAVLISGWFYLRNQLTYGQPVVGNWALPGEGRTWWSPPGFHTLDYYTQFGESLVHPWFSAFWSFWDALYSTMWGDGLVSGSASLQSAFPHWSYAWMTAGFLLATPVLTLMLIGFVRLALAALRADSASRRAVHALLVLFAGAMLFAIFYATLTLPYHGQAKAFYALSATPVLGLAFGRGYQVLDAFVGARAGEPGRAAVFGMAAACMVPLYLGVAG
jgi:hypothetical protein